MGGNSLIFSARMARYFCNISMESYTGHQKEVIAIFFEILVIYLGYHQNFVLENPQMRVSGQSARANPLHWSSINIFCTKNGFPVICGTRKNQSLVSSKIGGFACPQSYRSQASHRELTVLLCLRPLQAIVSA